jgi:shikimate dehydrogenase
MRVLGAFSPRPTVAALWNQSVPSATLIEKCCLIANPVAGNPTHYLVEQAFAHKGLDWRFMTFEVEPERLGDAIRGIRALGFRGVKVAEPFQESAIEHLDDLSERARRCGSVNVIVAEGDRLTGDNTEGLALVELIRQAIEPAGLRAMVIGAGRVARAIAVALADAGATSITIASRNATTGQRLVELIQQQTSAPASFVDLSSGTLAIEPDIAVLVNATSLGMADAEAKLSLDPNSFGPQLVVADVAYTTTRTWLTQQAVGRGCRIIDGLALYVEQTALAIRTWTGTMPNAAAMREAAEEFLGI